MPSFGSPAIPSVDTNPLADWYSANQTQLANQGAAQTLTDRATLRGLAPGLASGDPDAAATAATLPQAGGESALSGIAGLHSDQRAQLGSQLAVTGALSGAILNAPAEQRASLYKQFLPVLQKAGISLPADYPGDDSLAAHRTASLSTQEQITALGNVATADPYRTPLSGPAGPSVGPGGAIQGQGDAGQNSGAASGASGKQPVVPPGYMPFYQEASARTGIPVATLIAQGQQESGFNPGAIGTNGEIGVHQIKPSTAADPGYGMAAVDPATLRDPRTNINFAADYLKARAGAGANMADPATRDRALAAYNGGGDPNYVAHVTRYLPPQSSPAARPGVALAPDGSAAPVSGPQTASAGPIPGQPMADVGPANGAPAPSPGKGDQARAGGVDDVMARLRAGQAGQTPAASQPPIPNQNALLPVGDPSAAAPQNQLMPAASAAPPAPQPPQAPGAPAAASAAPAPGPQVAPPRALQPGETPLYLPGKGPMPGRTPGYQMTRMADGSYGQIRLPGTPPNIEYQKTEDAIVGIDKDTNQVVSRVPITSGARVTKVDGPGGTLLTQPGAPDRTIPYSGRPEQTDAYKSDLPRVEALTGAAQSAQASMPRLNEMADLAGQLATGGAAPELRAKAAAFLEQMGVSPEKTKSLTGMDSGAAAQLFTKLAISTAGAAAKADVGSNNGIQSTQLYQAANPGMSLLPDANKRVTNMMRVSAQQIQDYAQAALQHFGTNEQAFLSGGNYAPLTTFNRSWLAQSNPQIGAGAIGILNGDPYEKWSAGLKNPADIQRAQEMAKRVDPNVTIPAQASQGGLTTHPTTPPATAIPAAASRVQGTVYSTPKGPMTWTGTGWLPAGR